MISPNVPSKESAISSLLRLQRESANCARRIGFRSPFMIATIIAKPDFPTMSLNTFDSLIFFAECFKYIISMSGEGAYFSCLIF